MQVKPSVWMFVGQGAQYYQMGSDLYAADAVFRRTFDSCSELLRPVLDISLAKMIYRARDDRFAPFDRLLYSNPAICAVQYAVAQALRARGCEPDYVLGYSLGGITARIVAGALALEDGLRIAVRLAQLTEQLAPAGGMLAVLDRHESYPDTWTAARNFATHFVVAGRPGPLDRVDQQLKAKGVATQRLPVHFAFHCPLIDAIEHEFTAFLDDTPVADARVPVLPTEPVWDAVRQPVDFMAIIEDLEARGEYRYVDLGPSGTLATYVKYNLQAGSSSEILSTVTPFDRALANLQQVESTTST